MAAIRTEAQIAHSLIRGLRFRRCGQSLRGIDHEQFVSKKERDSSNLVCSSALH